MRIKNIKRTTRLQGYRTVWLAGLVSAACAIAIYAQPATESELSRRFHSVSYNVNELALAVQLKKSKRPLLFRGVPPATHQAFIKSEEPWTFYQEHIKPVFDTRPPVSWENHKLIPLKSKVFEGTAYNKSARKLLILWKNEFTGTFTDITPTMFNDFLSNRYKATFYQEYIKNHYVEPGSTDGELSHIEAVKKNGTTIDTPATAALSDGKNEADAYLQNLLTDLDEPTTGIAEPSSERTHGSITDQHKLDNLFTELADWESDRQPNAPQTAPQQNLALHLLKEFEDIEAEPGEPSHTHNQETNTVPNLKFMAIGLSEKENNAKPLMVDPIDTGVLPREDLEDLLSTLESENQSGWSTVSAGGKTNAPGSQVDSAESAPAGSP